MKLEGRKSIIILHAFAENVSVQRFKILKIHAEIYEINKKLFHFILDLQICSRGNI